MKTIQKKLPLFLNVITILTIIKCMYDLYDSFNSFFSGHKVVAEMQQALTQMETAPKWANIFISPDTLEVFQKLFQYRLQILIINLVGIVLCIYGAFQMRKLKKEGYTLWLLGEILPIIAILLFVGIIFFKTVYAFTLLFSFVFIIFYTTQRKYLNK